MARAQRGFAGIDARLRAQSPAAAARVRGALARAEDAVRTGDAGRARRGAAPTPGRRSSRGSAQAATDAAKAGDAATAGRWLLVREFRPPTRFSRPGADATLALRALARGKVTPAAAARPSAPTCSTPTRRGFSASSRRPARRGSGCRRGACRRPLWRAATRHVLRPAYRAQRGAAVTAADGRRSSRRCPASRTRRRWPRRAPRWTASAPRRSPRARSCAAPARCCRFIKLVPVEYGRGVDDGRVTLDFELQEAITFRDGAASALADLAPVLTRRDAAATKQLDAAGRCTRRGARGRGKHKTVADPDDISAQADARLRPTDELFPSEWREADETADFDVIARHARSSRRGGGRRRVRTGRAARLEAYAFFEFGPEQRLRGLAPDLFVKVEG